MKIVVVGGVAGGASVAARARRLDESAEIVVLERGEVALPSEGALVVDCSAAGPGVWAIAHHDPKPRAFPHADQRGKLEFVRARGEGRRASPVL